MKNRDDTKDWMIRKVSDAVLGKNWAPFDRLRANGSFDRLRANGPFDNAFSSERSRRVRANGWALHFWVALLVLVWGVLWFPLTAGAQESICAEVKLEIPQELTLERQGFEAHMRISNGLSHITLEHVHVTVTFTDEDGNQVTATSDPDAEPDLSDPLAPRFFIRLDDLEGIGAVDGSGTVASSSTADIRWLIIPVPGAGAPPNSSQHPPGPPQGGNQSSQEGRRYFVGATLTYTIGGETYVTDVTPDDILVKPMPQLFVDYFLPDEVYGDDAWTPETEPPIPFSLGVRVSNHGYGTARKLTIDSAQPRIVENTQGLLVDFLIEGSTVNDQPATPSLLVDFGNITPETAGVARWIMTCSLSGWFTDFTAEFSHSDELGGELTSLIEEVHTHYLVHDVLLDLPDRDGIRDFLATEQPCSSGETCGPYTLYESEITETDVLDLSDESTLTPVDGSTATYTLALATTPSSSSEDVMWYIHKPVPGAVSVPDTLELPVSAMRSDGKPIPPENVWMSKARREDHGWEYVVHLFDATSAETALPSCSYTLVFGEAEAMPPVLQPIPDQSVLEGELLAFTVEASCGQDAGQDESCTPGLSATPLPVGAEFTDHEDGTGVFTWTPADGQTGMYSLTLTASDGELTATQQVMITVRTDQQYTLTVELAGDGSGAVIGDGGIDCGTACMATFEKYTHVSLLATPDAGSIFAGAEGVDCSDSGECSFVITADTTVTVTFNLEPVITPEPTPENPIPEPATLVLIGFGLLGLLGLGLRKRRKRK